MTPFIDTEYDWHFPLVVPRGRRFTCDTETDGLLDTLTVIHEMVLQDLDTGEILEFSDQPGYTPMHDGMALLSTAELIFMHNGIGFDYKALKKVYPLWETTAKIIDTMVLSKMLWQTEKLRELDFPRWRRSKALEEQGKEPTFPGALIGAHKLEAWGYRLGKMKGDFSAIVKGMSKQLQAGTLEPTKEALGDYYPHICWDEKGKPFMDPWCAWSLPQHLYCIQDVEVTTEFVKLIMRHLQGTAKAAKGKGWSPRSVASEHRMWAFAEELKERGFGYNIRGGIQLAATLKNRKAELERTIQAGFGSWWEPLSDVVHGECPKVARSVVYLVDGEPLPDVTTPRIGKTGKPLAPYVGPPKAHYSPDAPFTKIERKSLNPGSLKQLGDRLIAVYGWQPSDWVGIKDDSGKGTQAKLDETVIKEMESSILPTALKDLLLEFMVVRKTLGQLSDGKKAWNELVDREDHRLHGRLDPLGTVTFRCAHSNPNLGQVPGVSFDEKKDDSGTVISKDIIWGWKGGFGAECRTLFTPGIRTKLGAPGFKEQTGIDASGLQLRCLGHYLQPYDDGAFATRVSTPGLDIHAENGKLTDLTRKDTKTVTYAWLFGAGNLKIGAQLGVPEELIDHYADSPSAKSYVKFMQRVQGPDFVPLNRMAMAQVGRGSEVSKKFINGIEGLKDLKDTIKAEAEEYGFIMALDGRKVHIRKAHASLNSMLMSAEAIICKAWMLETERLLELEGLRKDVDFEVLAFVHDEGQYGHREGLHEVIAAKGQQAMRNVEADLGFMCPLSTEAKLGHNWQECH